MTDNDLLQAYKEQAKGWREEARKYACDVDFWRGQAEGFERIAREQRATLEQVREKIQSLCYIAPEDVSRRAAALADLFQTVDRALGAADRDPAPIVPEPADEPKSGERWVIQLKRTSLPFVAEKDGVFWTAGGQWWKDEIAIPLKKVADEEEWSPIIPQPHTLIMTPQEKKDLAETLGPEARRYLVPEVAGPPSKIAHLPERLGRPNEVQVGYDGAWDDDDLLG